MATKQIQYESFKRGDTPTFRFDLEPPTDQPAYDWSGTTADMSITRIENPGDNTAAGVYRPNVSLTVGTGNIATVSMQPTIVESKALSPGENYFVEIQLKEGGVNVITPISGTVLVEQDYVI